MSVILAGTGCGALENMTVEVRQALLDADLIIGAKRLIEGLPAEYPGERIPAIYAEEICGIIQERLREQPKGEEPQICVAFSGDSGFYSGTRTLQPLLEEAGIEARILPGISSIQMLSARLMQPWQDWSLVSAHGMDCDAVTAVMQDRPVFFLTGGKLTPTELCEQLAEAGLGELSVTVAERLTYEDERIITGTAAEFAQKTFAPLAVMLAQPAGSPREFAPGIDDSMFIRGDVPMTKQDIRAAIQGHLQVRRADTVWDVGAGTGSVSVELAMRARDGRVYAVEREPEGVELIRKNREEFLVWNLCVVEGAAPKALRILPAPDKVFIGGSDGNLQEIIELALDKNPAVRICVSAIVLETMQEAVDVMTRAGMDLEIVQVSVGIARRIGREPDKKHMMMGGNPIFIITGQRPKELPEARSKEQTEAQPKDLPSKSQEPTAEAGGPGGGGHA